jgi:hypothetical protein
METLYWVRLPYATFGLVVLDGIVVAAAPIARRNIGRPIDKVVQYYQKKSAKVVERAKD